MLRLVNNIFPVYREYSWKTGCWTTPWSWANWWLSDVYARFRVPVPKRCPWLPSRFLFAGCCANMYRQRQSDNRKPTCSFLPARWQTDGCSFAKGRCLLFPLVRVANRWCRPIGGWRKGCLWGQLASSCPDGSRTWFSLRVHKNTCRWIGRLVPRICHWSDGAPSQSIRPLLRIGSGCESGWVEHRAKSGRHDRWWIAYRFFGR